VTWNGDISHMGQLASTIGRLASVPSRASRAIAVDIGEMLEEQFAAGADPYGDAWDPLEDVTLEKRSQTTEPPLTDFGRMRGSMRVRPMSGAGVAITIDHPAAPHQTGWSGPQGEGPARPILPDRGMPARWREAIAARVDEAVRS